MNVRPLRDNIYVRRLPDVNRGTIIIPDVAQEPSTRWEVLAVGPGKLGKKGHRIPCDVKPGDVVVLGHRNDYEAGELAIFMEGDVRYVESSNA